MDSYSRYTTNARFFLIALTRSVHHFTLYTDNAAALRDKLVRSPAHKFTALESIQAYPFVPKPPIKTASPKTPVPIDLDRITRDLHTHAEAVVGELLGKPLSQTTTHYRYSHSAVLGGETTKTRGGSLFVAIRGSKAGLWHSFKTGEGGNLLQLIQKKVGGNFQKSVHIAQDLLGGQAVFFDAPVVPKKITTSPKTERKSLAYARRLARESRKISGTLAEQYLRQHRGITLTPLPKDLRYHPGIYSAVNQALHPALLAIARNKEGHIQAVQAIYLDKDTGYKAKVSVVKQTWGSLAGAAVDMSVSSSSTPPGVTYLAEGIETALSLTQSINAGEVKAVLGKSNFARTSISESNPHVVLCLDNDGSSAPDATVQKAAVRLTKQGARVWIAQPKGAGQDYNDVLRQEGSKAVKASVDSAWAFSIGVGEKGRSVAHPSVPLAKYLEGLTTGSQKNNTRVLADASTAFVKPLLQKVALGQKAKEVEIEI